MCDKLREKYPNIAVILAGVDGDKVNLCAGAGQEAVKKGVHCGNLIKKAAQTCGGGGGGRPDSATAGGKNPDKLEQAFNEFKEILKQNQ